MFSKRFFRSAKAVGPAPAADLSLLWRATGLLVSDARGWLLGLISGRVILGPHETALETGT